MKTKKKNVVVVEFFLFWELQTSTTKNFYWRRWWTRASCAAAAPRENSHFSPKHPPKMVPGDGGGKRWSLKICCAFVCQNENESCAPLGQNFRIHQGPLNSEILDVSHPYPLNLRIFQGGGGFSEEKNLGFNCAWTFFWYLRVPTYFSAYLPGYLPTCWTITFLPACLHILPIYFPANLCPYVPTYLLICLPGYVQEHAYLPSRLPIYLPT